MPDWSGFLGTIKTAALDAVNAEKPTSVLFGKVISVSPLKISIDQKMTLEHPQLILTRNVTDYKINDDVAVYNALKANDGVVLIRVQGGQKFLVVDRLG